MNLLRSFIRKKNDMAFAMAVMICACACALAIRDNFVVRTVGTSMKGTAPILIVDAGHGGSDSGAMSPHGHKEKDANLMMAKAVRQALENSGYRVVMTREDDSFPALYDRPKVAHREKADAFVSIHYNAPAYDRNPMEIRYHAVYAWNPLGEKLAGAINQRMAGAMPDVTNNGVMHANFAVTRNPEIPSCLIETDFLSSPEGEELAFDSARRSSIAASIAAGIDDWAKGK